MASISFVLSCHRQKFWYCYFPSCSAVWCSARSLSSICALLLVHSRSCSRLACSAACSAVCCARCVAACACCSARSAASAACLASAAWHRRVRRPRLSTPRAVRATRQPLLLLLHCCCACCRHWPSAALLQHCHWPAWCCSRHGPHGAQCMEVARVPHATRGAVVVVQARPLHAGGLVVVRSGVSLGAAQAPLAVQHLGPAAGLMGCRRARLTDVGAARSRSAACQHMKAFAMG